ncbi:MAG: UbiA family prenyltransferase [Chlorobiaceae bacterium]|nr:UbiA family prenyltransferase [Chlorobiaceae bacterium]NTW09876.1 UbiA family prenyltransferase [Chlorobiaceae bacterium]
MASDIETDRINNPSRPLPSGFVSKNKALFLSVVAAFAGFLFSSMSGLHAFLLVFAVWTAGLLYNWKLNQSFSCPGGHVYLLTFQSVIFPSYQGDADHGYTDASSRTFGTCGMGGFHCFFCNYRQNGG